MALDTDRYYGALGFEFHQNRLKKFKKGEVVLCMGSGNNYDLPFGWEAPFIYSKFVEVFSEHFVATEDGSFSIDRIFKVDKEYRFYVPQIDMHFISYFRNEVIENDGLIHFNWIDKNPIKENFAIPIDAPVDLIKTQLAYTKGIQLFELRKSSKSVATKSVKKDKPVIENKKSFQLPEQVVKTINKYVPKLDGVEMLPVKSVPAPSAEQEPEANIEITAKRDKKAQKRDEIIKFRVTGEVKLLIQELAKHDDQDSVADLIKASIRKYALSSIKFKTPFDFSKLEIIK